LHWPDARLPWLDGERRARAIVVRGCCSGLVSLNGRAGKDTGTGFTEASEAKAKKSSAMLLPATNNRGSWDVLCVTACFISLPSKFPCTTGFCLSDQHILSPINYLH
jgi:hypothetical protein